jgi:uroporphyrinogen decarboxylase
MHKKERVRAALAGKPVDRVPMSFWGHDYLREWTARGLADAMLESFHRHDWDFMKVNPRATYYGEAWGSTYEPSNDPARGPLTRDYPLKTDADLEKVRTVTGTDGVFSEQLEALRYIQAGIRGADYVQTVFSPLSVIGYLADRRLDAVRNWMEEAPAQLEEALGNVATTLSAYASACLEAGASGIFFATTDWATRTNLTPDLYARFGRPYDLRVLSSVQDAELNVLHVCRGENMLIDLLDYPVHVFNWADREAGNPSLPEVASRSRKAVMGGVSQATLSKGAPTDVAREVQSAIASMGGRRLFLSPGCSISPQTSEENLEAAARARTP